MRKRYFLVFLIVIRLISGGQEYFKEADYCDYNNPSVIKIKKLGSKRIYAEFNPNQVVACLYKETIFGNE